MSVKVKLIVLSVGIGVVSLASIGLISIQRSNDALFAQQQESLSGIRTLQQQRIEDYFGVINEQVFNFGQNRMITEATAGFAEAFSRVPEQLGIDTEPGSDAHRAVAGYYDNQFQPRARDAGIPYRGADTYVPATHAARILQSLYIANNPHPVGEKLNLDRAPQDCAYNTLHATYHPRVRDFLNSFGYYDIFLFDTQGNLTYSVFKETDYATNFLSGPYKDTNFADVYRAALASNTPGDVVIEDYKPYEPSYGAPASFIGTPVFHDGQKVGVAVFQMPVDKINDVMANTTGLGETGESYLVGPDQLMRCNSRLCEDGLLNQKVDSESARRALGGETDTLEGLGYRGALCLSAFAPLGLEGLDWAILTEMDYAEVAAPGRALQRAIAFTGLGLALVVGLVAFFFASALIKPIYGIVERAKEIASGNLTSEALGVKNNDELGDLTGSINAMSESLNGLVREVSEAADDVAATATQIAATSEQMAASMNSQTEQTTQVSAAVEEMSATVSDVASKSTSAAAEATDAGRQAAAGGEVVSQTIDAINDIAELVRVSTASVNELGQRSQEIGQVIEVINDIADQTNLLALNAAIEAARAGEHGRGFAVVADEVRKLAERTTQATEEVGTSIKTIQVETEQAVQRMGASDEKVNAGVRMAQEAGQSLSAIVDGSGGVSTMIESIASSCDEQSTATHEIARSVEGINAASRQSADASGQSAQAAEQLSRKAEQLTSLISRFKTR